MTMGKIHSRASYERHGRVNSFRGCQGLSNMAADWIMRRRRVQFGLQSVHLEIDNFGQFLIATERASKAHLARRLALRLEQYGARN